MLKKGPAPNNLGHLEQPLCETSLLTSVCPAAGKLMHYSLSSDEPATSARLKEISLGHEIRHCVEGNKMRFLRNPLVLQFVNRTASSMSDAVEAPLRHALHTFADGGINIVAKQAVLSLLQSELVQSLDFVVAKFPVNANTFNSVGRAILLGKINVTVLLPNDTRFPEYAAMYNDIGAIYDKKINTLILKKLLDAEKPRRFRAPIIHETVHAAHDVGVLSSMMRLHTEAIAYTAEAVFLRTDQTSSRRPDDFLSMPAGAPEDDVLKFAWNIANKIVGDGQTTGQKNVPDSDSDWTGLLDAIKRTQMYSVVFPWQELAGYDGV
jgi:hypothetical protein